MRLRSDEPHGVIVVRTRVRLDEDIIDSALCYVDVPSLGGLAETAVCKEPALSVLDDFTDDVSVGLCELRIAYQISDTVLACPCAHDPDLELVAFIEDDVLDLEDVRIRIDLCELEVLLDICALVPVAALEGSCTGTDEAPCVLIGNKCALVACKEVDVLGDRLVEVIELCL